MIIKLIRKYQFILLISLFFIFLRLPSLFEPNWYGDEGIYLVLGQAIRKGQILYSQIHDNKPPTLYYLAAISQSVFGFRLLLSLWMIPTIYIFHLLSKKNLLATIIFMVITSIPLIEGNIANAEIFMLLPTILGIYLFLHSTSGYRFLITGFLLGLAFTIKVPVAVEFAFIFLYSLLFIPASRWLNLFKLSLGFILPITLYYIYFYFQGATDEFLFAALFQNFGYLSSWASGSHSGSATNSGLISRGIILLVSWATLYLYFKKTSKPNLHNIFLLGWFFSCLFGSLLSTRPYPHYLIQLLPSLVLIFSNFKNLKIIFSTIIILFFIIIHYKFYFYPVLSYYQNFYLNANQLRFFGNDIVDTQKISDYLRTHSTGLDRIFVWGDQPFIYLLSDRLPIGRFTVSYHIADFNQYDYISDQLKIHLPKFIVYYQMPSRPFAKLDVFLNKYYLPVYQSGSGIIYSIRQ